MKPIETVIVGGGQAGLAMSYYLAQHRREHVVLERAAQAGSAWRDERWDSFTLVTPNWAFRLPGAQLNGADRDGFLSRDQVVAYFDQFVERFRPPIQYNTPVLAVEPLGSQGYRVQTPEHAFHSGNVVIATGFYQRPKLPAFAAELSPAITQLHSSAYRNPNTLPAGAVLVVGSGQSGCQIVEELYQTGRHVFLCTGSAGRLPRRYRGKDVIAWLEMMGFFDLTPEELPPGMSKFEGIPHLSGVNGGHTLNLHRFARDGVQLLGHLRGAAGHKLTLAADLYENLAKVDQFELEVLKMIDGAILEQGLDAPPEEVPQLRDGYEQAAIQELDLKATGINTVIWAMGYTFDYSLVKLPVCDADGFPIQTSGATSYPGLYFLGMPWMPTERSGFMLGVGDAARQIAATITEADAHR